MSLGFDGEKREIQLPARESQVLALGAKGFTDKQIAAELGISRDTVGTYWRRILLRFGASSRTEVVARATESELKAHVELTHQENARLMQEIRDRSEAQARELNQKNLLAVVQEALLDFVSGASRPEAVLNHLLDDILVLTNSAFGFIGELITNSDGTTILRNFSATDISWDEDSRQSYERTKIQGFEFKSYGNLFGAVATSKATVVSNHPTSDPRSGGVPDGHPPITAYLGMPVMCGSEVVGMIGIANRPGGYDEGIVEFLEPFAATCGTIIYGVQNQELKRQAELEAAATLARLEALLNALHSAVVFIDNDRRIRFVNAAFLREFMPGCEADEVIGKSSMEMLDRFPQTIPDSGRQRVEDIVAHEDSIIGEQIRIADGRTFLRDFHKVRSGNVLLGHLWKFRGITTKDLD